MEIFDRNNLPEIAPNPDPMGLQVGGGDTPMPGDNRSRPNGGGLTAPGAEIFTHAPEVPAIAVQLAPLALGQISRPE